ncbi:DsbA family oxidoreductase [Cyclobacterium amurskyense]|uniref:2-hydroxychromene-2-carboxylate isomerase/DsbA-like thioredoxin domain protein n=1 Tax=Cyclobacterium amurskyense TaxID=320787 RepID=A0A0H4PCX5_9BACT|nr:DsbA family oxidoreductase [Cyclobacterium amurskyense]AKP50688.1 2-hydroxychromene-2-carboxylate isomerase/DsbA-like thioredoxin domain protein [Cyclobacterium amurskyense]|tara:strand:- start:164 stop:823 length:660 start_codon:yes stop_codon:yes gene_type:complete
MMKIEIWSDIVCPFCYIGKRRFENALAKFDKKDQIEVIYKSFQLNPEIKTDMDKSVVQYLSESKGVTLEKAREMTEYVTQQAGIEGLDYKMDKAVVANTFRSHRLLHLALAQGLQLEMKERLLKAYFIEGKNIDDVSILADLAKEVGITNAEETLKNDNFTDQVKRDLMESKQIGIQGVPFFVFNGKYGISGAQESKVFAEAIEQSFKEWEEDALQPKG